MKEVIVEVIKYGNDGFKIKWSIDIDTMTASWSIHWPQLCPVVLTVSCLCYLIRERSSARPSWRDRFGLAYAVLITIAAIAFGVDDRHVFS
jgi:hypothetical protein